MKWNGAVSLAEQKANKIWEWMSYEHEREIKWMYSCFGQKLLEGEYQERRCLEYTSPKALHPLYQYNNGEHDTGQKPSKNSYGTRGHAVSG